MTLKQRLITLQMFHFSHCQFVNKMASWCVCVCVCVRVCVCVFSRRRRLLRWPPSSSICVSRCSTPSWPTSARRSSTTLCTEHSPPLWPPSTDPPSRTSPLKGSLHSNNTGPTPLHQKTELRSNWTWRNEGFYMNSCQLQFKIVSSSGDQTSPAGRGSTRRTSGRPSPTSCRGRSLASTSSSSSTSTRRTAATTAPCTSSASWVSRSHLQVTWLVACELKTFRTFSGVTLF